MALQQIFDSASSLMTVVSFTTFLGILAWTYVLHKNKDFEAAAALPFADELIEEERDHG